jgi:hypothetical protein
MDYAKILYFPNTQKMLRKNNRTAQRRLHPTVLPRRHHQGHRNDALGREVWRKTLAMDVEQVTVDLGDGRFADGIYWVILRTKEGMVSKKLVLSRE